MKLKLVTYSTSCYVKWFLNMIYFRLHNNLPDETQLPNGQKFELLSLALLGVPSMAEKFMEVSFKPTA
jgi:nuclear receptor subfamily 5 group A protein 3